MKSVQRRFKNLETKNKYWSSHTIFAEAIAGQNFNKTILKRNFNKLVDVDDYSIEDKKEVLRYLETI